jgi:hypothetical protein
MKEIFNKICRWFGRLGLKIIGMDETKEFKKPETFERALFLCATGYHCFSQKDKDILKNQKTANDFAVVLHHNYGRKIRNDYGLWNEESKLVDHMKRRFGIDHPDDISAVLLMCTWQILNKKPITPQKFALRFIEYWKEVNGGSKSKSTTLEVRWDKEHGIMIHKPNMN